MSVCMCVCVYIYIYIYIYIYQEIFKIISNIYYFYNVLFNEAISNLQVVIIRITPFPSEFISLNLYFHYRTDL